jgi:GT2 family glycosyltransferase
MSLSPAHNVVICTLNREVSLNRLLSSLIETEIGLNLRVIIVDSSNDQNYRNNLQKSLIHNFHSSSAVIYDAGGLPSCRNVAIQEVTGELIHFFDDDLTVESNYFTEVSKFFLEYPDCGGGGPRIRNLYNTEKIKKIKSFLGLDPLSHQGKVTKSGRNFWVQDNPNQESLRVDWIPGCSMIFKKEVLRDFLFNQNLEKGPGRNYALGEDVDFGWRVSQKYTLRSIPNIVVDHHLAPSKRDDPSLMLKANGTWYAYLHRLTKGRVKMRFILLVSVSTFLYRAIFENFLLIIRVPSQIMSNAYLSFRDFFIGSKALFTEYFAKNLR